MPERVKGPAEAGPFAFGVRGLEFGVRSSGFGVRSGSAHRETPLLDPENGWIGNCAFEGHRL